MMQRMQLDDCGFLLLLTTSCDCCCLQATVRERERERENEGKSGALLIHTRTLWKKWQEVMGLMEYFVLVGGPVIALHVVRMLFLSGPKNIMFRMNFFFFFNAAFKFFIKF
jgi:hypothetical protein